MMKTALFASLVASAAAFAPASTTRSASALSGVADDMPGAIDYKGQEFFFDPLKLSETYEPLVPFFRECEIRHGRTAMLAVLGWITTDFVRIPGDMYSFEHIPASKDAHDILIGDGPMVQLLMWVGLFDLIVTGPATSATMKGERTPGDYGVLIAAPTNNPEAMKAAVDKELLNGRLAMIAIGGIATQSVLTGHSFPYI